MVFGLLDTITPPSGSAQSKQMKNPFIFFLSSLGGRVDQCVQWSSFSGATQRTGIFLASPGAQSCSLGEN